MNYQIKAFSHANQDAEIHIKESNISFGTTPATVGILPSPAELFLGAFASCVLKNVERFSKMMKFTYTKASIEVSAIRLEKPPRMDQIEYILTIYSNDEKLNVKLLKKNIERHGTIYNTVQLSCTITVTIKTIPNV
jgi:uncharacterized OsmC-like protein